ncbi:MAG: glycosyl transferase, partial [Acidobacteriota bacterium]
QAMFVVREVFQQAGGFTEIPLMEDIELSRRLKRSGPPLCLRDKVVTSGRRWEKGGVLRTVVLMWRLRLGYYLGRDPARLAVEYGYAPPES